MDEKLGQISLYLAKERSSFDSIICEEKVSIEGENLKIVDFKYQNVEARFFCKNIINKDSMNPSWLDFVNQKIDQEKRISFPTYVKRPREGLNNSLFSPWC